MHAVLGLRHSKVLNPIIAQAASPLCPLRWGNTVHSQPRTRGYPHHSHSARLISGHAFSANRRPLSVASAGDSGSSPLRTLHVIIGASGSAPLSISGRVARMHPRRARLLPQPELHCPAAGNGFWTDSRVFPYSYDRLLFLAAALGVQLRGLSIFIALLRTSAASFPSDSPFKVLCAPL